MKRVLHLIDSFDLGGAQTVLLDLAVNLREMGHGVEVAAMHGNGVFRGAFERAGIPTHSLSRSKFPPGYLLGLPSLLRGGNFDVLHAHLFGSIWIGLPAAALLRVPVRIAHDHCNDAKRHGGGIFPKIDAAVNRLAHAVIAVSSSTHDFLVGREGIDPRKVFVVHNGVETRRFQPPSPAARSAARARFGVEPEAFLVGGVGRFVRQKNFSALLEAVAMLLPCFPNLRVLLAGSGPLDSDLRAQAARLGITGRVIFAGFVADRPALYHALDCLALPSLFEGLPMTLLEAMAAGVPVIASRVDGMAEILTHEADGLLFETGSAEGCAGALRCVIGDAAMRERLALNARELVKSRFSAVSQAEQVAELYKPPCPASK